MKILLGRGWRISEGVNSYMKNNLGLETHINGKDMKIKA